MDVRWKIEGHALRECEMILKQAIDSYRCGNEIPTNVASQHIIAGAICSSFVLPCQKYIKMINI